MAKKTETIWIDIDGKSREVSKADYIKAKTKDLREFGYTTLTEAEVGKALERAIAGGGADVISMLIESDLLKD